MPEAERLCDYPLRVRRSKGTINCPVNLFKGYKENTNCQNCPKVTDRMLLGLSARDISVLNAMFKANSADIKEA